jgi:hypothetical protein
MIPVALIFATIWTLMSMGWNAIVETLEIEDLEGK